jgi:MFS family permease
MNLDELRNDWMAEHEQLASRVRLHGAWLREAQAGRGNAALGRLTRRLWLALGLNVLLAGLLGGFMGKHLGELRFLGPALVLHVFTIGLIVSAAWQLVAIRRLDFNAPILTSQRQLEALRIHRIRETKWTLFLAPLLWVPLLVVGLKVLAGVDAYAVFPASWLVANLLFGLACIPLLWWASRRFSERFSSSPVLQRVMDDVAGRNLREARQYLARLAEFETTDRAV